MYDFLKENFSNIRKYLDLVDLDDSWVSKGALLQTHSYLLAGLDDNYARASSDMEYIFSDNRDITYQTQKTVNLLNKWDDNPVSMVGIITYAIDRLGFSDGDEEYIASMMVAAVLAEVNNDLPYHNNMHFKKVVLHMVRMIVAHNDIFAGTRNAFSKNKISTFIVSAAIHDLDHKGKGNIIDRKYYMAKVEQHSFDLALPYFKAAGMSDKELADIRIMLITTDTSPFGDPISPANQSRAAYEYHYGLSEEDDNLTLTDDLIILNERDDLTLMCMMLHEADIMNSAALDYEITKKESIAVSKEVGRDKATPEDTLVFMEKICDSQMMSDSARQIGSHNMDVILSKVMHDFKDGNKSYL